MKSGCDFTKHTVCLHCIASAFEPYHVCPRCLSYSLSTIQSWKLPRPGTWKALSYLSCFKRKRKHRPSHFDLAVSAEDHPQRAGSGASFKLDISWLPLSIDICSVETSTERQTTSHHALHITARGYRDFSC
jgi:hypothetical protein